MLRLRHNKGATRRYPEREAGAPFYRHCAMSTARRIGITPPTFRHAIPAKRGFLGVTTAYMQRLWRSGEQLGAQKECGEGFKYAFASLPSRCLVLLDSYFLNTMRASFAIIMLK